MEKVYSLNSAKPSYLIAAQHPRSLKYYLSAGLHHKIVGRFATVAFFSIIDTELKKNERDSIQLEKSSDKTKGKVKNNVKNPSFRASSPKGSKPKVSVTTANRFEHGPIANYANVGSDPRLIKKMVKLSNEVLASARTVFPVDPFPDTVVLDRTTLNITKRTFFFSNDTLSIRIEDILNAHVNIGPFLGSLTIASRILSSEDHFTINNLWRKDAVHLKHMIQGYIIALHNEIEISHLSKEELIETISELGHDLNS